MSEFPNNPKSFNWRKFFFRLTLVISESGFQSSGHSQANIRYAMHLYVHRCMGMVRDHLLDRSRSQVGFQRSE